MHSKEAMPETVLGEHRSSARLIGMVAEVESFTIYPAKADRGV